MTTDEQYRITSFNPAAVALTGWAENAVLGLPLGDVLRSSEGRPYPELELALGVSEGVVARRDAQTVAVTTVGSVIRRHDGQVGGMVYVLHEGSNDEQRDRLQYELLSTISHELRTPLGYIKGYATTLLLPNALFEADTVRRCLGVIVEASNEIEELVDKLLDISKIEAGVLTVHPRRIRLSTVVRRAIQRSGLRTRGRRVRLTITRGLPIVCADPRRIEQVLSNLLNNAAKYSPQDGAISVDIATLDNEVRVSISNGGPGISDADLARLFQRFQRGSSARIPQIAGHGLGLAICKGIIEAHGGRIWLESSAPGRHPTGQEGTVARFSLPAAETRGISRRRSPRTKQAPVRQPSSEAVTSVRAE